MLFVDMQHSQPHITLYQAVLFLGWFGIILRKVESLMIILLSGYIVSFGPPSSGGINILLFSSLTET